MTDLIICTSTIQNQILTAVLMFVFFNITKIYCLLVVNV